MCGGRQSGRSGTRTLRGVAPAENLLIVSLPRRDSASPLAEPSASEPSGTRYELRFTSLSDRGRGYAFPCDAQGHVDLDALPDGPRASYFFARTVIGSVLSAPTVSRVP